MNRRYTPSLRTKFLLIVLVGAVLPLAVFGLWLTGTAERSAETLLRARLDATLRQLVADVSRRWVTVRTPILDLADLYAAGPRPEPAGDYGTTRPPAVPSELTLHRQTQVVSSDALEMLRLHRWPGNVRELENCLTRAVVVCTGDVIRPEHLVVGPATPGDPEDLPTLAELERAHVERVLQATGGRKGRSARILGISRPRLNRLIEKYGIGHG